MTNKGTLHVNGIVRTIPVSVVLGFYSNKWKIHKDPFTSKYFCDLIDLHTVVLGHFAALLFIAYIIWHRSSFTRKLLNLWLVFEEAI